jgi:hypothetical protein
MAERFGNNATTTLATALASGGTTITVADGSVFPTLSSSLDYFYATIENDAGSYEVVKVTAVSGNDLTVTRAQQSTSAGTWSVGDEIELRLTATGLNDIRGWKAVNLQNSAAIANTTAVNSLFDKTLTVPAGTLNRIGARLRVCASGTYSTAGGSDASMTLYLNFGSHAFEVASFFLGNGVTDYNWNLDVELVVTSITGAGIIEAFVGRAGSAERADTRSLYSTATAAETVNIANAVVINIGQTWSAASASNTVVQNMLLAEVDYITEVTQ